MSLVPAVVLFALFTANVALGAFRDAAILGDVGEMLLLFAVAIAFVVAILRREAARNSEKNRQDG